MKKTPLTHAGLIIIILLILVSKTFAQDFILTKDNELIKAYIKIDSPNYVIYMRSQIKKKQTKSDIKGYAISGKKKKPAILEITNMQGTRLRGSFLYADQDSLYFWRGSNTYHPHKGSFYVIDINQVEQMIVHRKGNFLRGFTIGSIIGGSFGLLAGASLDGFITGSPAGDVLFSTALFSGSAGLVGGLIGSISTRHVQFDDPKNEIITVLPRLKQHAMLLTPPIKLIGRDTQQANWITKEPTLYKSRAPRKENLNSVLIQPDGIYSKAESVSIVTETHSSYSTKANSTAQPTQPNIVSSKIETNLAAIESSPASKKNNSAPSQTILSLQFYGGFQLISAQRYNIKNSLIQSGQNGVASSSYYSTPVTYPVKQNTASFLDFSIQAKLNEKHRVALTYTKTNSFGARGITGLTETGKKKAAELYYLFVPKNYTPNKLSNWESSIGIGPSLSFLETEITYYTQFDNYYAKNKFGLSGQFSCSYYLNPNFSFDFKFLGRLTPGMTIPERPDLREHKINFSSFDVAFGIGVHL